MNLSDARTFYVDGRRRLEHALANTPDDRLLWAPSPTARTPLAQVVHSAMSTGYIQSWLTGTPFADKTSAEATGIFHSVEATYTTRESALALLEEKSAAFLGWLDSLTPEDLERHGEAPFGLGPVKWSDGIFFPGLHMRDHAAQLEYTQTIYGDTDWHFGF